MDQNITLGRFINPGHAIEERRLTGTIQAHNTKNIPTGDLQRDILQRGETAKTLRYMRWASSHRVQPHPRERSPMLRGRLRRGGHRGQRNL